MILAIVMLMVKPKVSTMIPRSNTIGLVNPKLCPYASQPRPGTPAARFPINPPNTMPANNNKNNAQLIFTTHDASIAGEEFMRADQIWFAEKKADGTSDLFSAIDFEGVSINTPFEMWYRTGRFGAVPRLSLIDDIFEDD